MKKQKIHNPHRFIANIFGSVGYVALLFIWLLLIQMVVLQFPAGSDSFFSTVGVVAQDSAGSGRAAEAHVALRFLLVIILAAIIWGVAYYGTMITSRLLRLCMKLCHIKPTNESLAIAKYLSVVIGLAGIATLLLLLPHNGLLERFAFAFLAFVAGIVAFSAFWVQNLVAYRHSVRVGDLR